MAFEVVVAEQVTTVGAAADAVAVGGTETGVELVTATGGTAATGGATADGFGTLGIAVAVGTTGAGC